MNQSVSLLTAFCLHLSSQSNYKQILKIIAILFMCRWHRDVLWHEVLQWPVDGSRAIRKCSIRGASEEGQGYLHFQTGMGISQESVFQWWWMHAPSTWYIPISTKLCPSTPILHQLYIHCCNVFLICNLLVIVSHVVWAQMTARKYTILQFSKLFQWIGKGIL